jgi:acyl dehydratase
MAATLGFAEIAPGLRFRSPGRTLTESDHQLFMMLTGDWHPIHADAEYAATTKAGQRLMHGALGIALAMGMQTAAVEFADPILGALGFSEWSFRKPLFIGDTVHVEVEFLSKRATSGGGRYVVERRLSLKKAEEVIQDGIATVMLKLPEGARA